MSKNCFQTGTGYGSSYPKRFYQYFEDSDFWKKLHNPQSFIYYLQKHLYSLLRHDSENGELQNRADQPAAEQGGPFDNRTDGVKNYYFSQLQTFIALYKMADRSMQGRTALNIIEIASFRCSSRCATWRAVRYNIARTSCFENDDLSSLLHALEFCAARATAQENNLPSYRY